MKNVLLVPLLALVASLCFALPLLASPPKTTASTIPSLYCRLGVVGEDANKGKKIWAASYLIHSKNDTATEF